MYRVGDVVRVKADALWVEKKCPVGPGQLCRPCKDQLGKKLEVHCLKDWSDGDTVVYFHKVWPGGNVDNYGDGVSQRFLEPWNDSEEWDGEKWVPKKCMPETITVNGVEYVRKGKTSAEKLADALNDVSNTIASIKRVYATADGNVVTARYELED